MNTNPDDTRLALWLEDELEEKDFPEVDGWAAGLPEQLAAREELRSYRAKIKEVVPASIEPPYPEFFISRVRQGIRDLGQDEEQGSRQVPMARPFWRTWAMPAVACAGMLFTFIIGKQSGKTEGTLAVVQDAGPVVYTPEAGVNAEWFASADANATVIVLQGVSAIPDSMDFSETVYVPTAREADRTAENREAAEPSIEQ